MSLSFVTLLALLPTYQERTLYMLVKIVLSAADNVHVFPFQYVQGHILCHFRLVLKHAMDVWLSVTSELSHSLSLSYINVQVPENS